MELFLHLETWIILLAVASVPVVLHSESWCYKLSAYLQAQGDSLVHFKKMKAAYYKELPGVK